MAAKKFDALQAELAALLEARFPEIDIDIDHSKRWDRPCATLVWYGFAGLLPEERFHRLTRFVPEGFREKHMKGYVWLELAPGESIEQFLSLPRSEDVAGKEREIYGALVKSGFFRKLGRALGTAPERNCGGDFAHTIRIMTTESMPSVSPQDAKLAFIRHGVYCDCQINRSAEPAMAKLYAGAA